MFDSANLSSINKLASTERPDFWYESPSYLLNGVRPSFIHDYMQNKFWNSSSGASSFPFTSTRTTNAMQYTRQGNLAWAPANMIPRSEISGGAVGVIGSGGAVPTGWVWSSGDVGLVREILEITSEYVTFRISGTNTNGVSISYPHFAFNSASVITPIVGQSYTFSCNVRVIDGNFTGFVSGATSRIVMQWRTSGGTYISESSASSSATTTDARLVSTGVAPATAAQCSAQVNIAVNPLASVNLTLRVYRPQVEPTSVDSPRPYLPTTGTARYGERIDYDPQTLAMRGLLVEGAATNFLVRSSATAASWEAASYATPTDAGTQWGFPVVSVATNATTNSQFSYITGNSFTPSISTQYVITAFVKKNTYRYCQITPSANFTGNPPAGAWLNYDFDTNTFQQGGTDAIAGSGLAEVLNNGWVRLQLAFTSTSTTSGAGVIFGFPNSLADTRLVICSTLGASYFVFGCQLEAGNVATSHIPTYGTTITRAADIYQLTPVPWLNQANGTGFVRFIPNKADSTNLRRMFDISDNSTNNRVQLGRSINTSVSGVSSLAGVPDFTPGVANLAAPFVVSKAAIEYTPGDKRVVLNGGSVGTSTNINVPTSGFTHLIMGSVPGFAAGNTLGGWIQEFRHYPTISASDAQLQALTT